MALFVTKMILFPEWYCQRGRFECHGRPPNPLNARKCSRTCTAPGTSVSSCHNTPSQSNRKVSNLSTNDAYSSFEESLVGAFAIGSQLRCVRMIVKEIQQFYEGRKNLFVSYGERFDFIRISKESGGSRLVGESDQRPLSASAILGHVPRS